MKQAFGGRLVSKVRTNDLSILCAFYCKTAFTYMFCSSFLNANVELTFYACLFSKLQLRCCNCGHCSDTYETLIDLSLEIEDVDSLATALESFTKVEKIEDSETKFTCEKCKEQVSIEKQLVLDKAPSVAALHLKRFKTDGSLVEKIDKYVSFPLELDLHAYADNNQSDNVSSCYSESMLGISVAGILFFLGV